MSVHQRKVVAIGAGAVAAAAAPLMVAGTVEAASFEVTNLNDTGAGSLRQAILDANAAAGADFITFQSGLTGTIVLVGQLQITDSLTITGPGAAVLTVSGDDDSRVFYLYNSSTNINVVISGLTVADGYASVGAGLRNRDEDLTLDRVTFRDNTALGNGGALWLDGFNMSVTITDSVLSGNVAGTDGGGEGGAIYLEDTGGPTLIQRTVISGNTANGNGGGIYFYDPDDAVTIVDSTISGNTASGTGGGISLYDTDGGPFTIERTTISGNTAAQGGGIYFYQPDDLVQIINSTISGNHAIGGDGGGIMVDDFYSDSLSIEHTTIAGNDASVAGGNASFPVGVNLDHVLIADGVAPAAADLSAESVNADFSLIEDATGVTIVGANNVTGADPVLGALQANGGPTETRLLGAGSPAIGAGDPAFVAPPLTDQRGAQRVLGLVIDIGATEQIAAPVDDTGVTTQDTPLVVAAPGVLSNDPDGAVSTAQVATLPTHGDVVLNADGSYTYTPDAGYFGADSFTYVASVNGVAGGTATVSITINQGSVVLTAVNDVASVSIGGSVVITVLANDSVPVGSTVTISGVTQGLKGTVTIVGNTVVYRPNLSASGPDSFTYTITDGVTSSTATVSVTLIPSQIPATGSSSLPTAGIAAGLLAAGAALTAGSRRRRTTPAD